MFHRQKNMLEPTAWTETHNLPNIYACDYSRSLAHQALNEIAGLDDAKFNPSIGESVSRTVLRSNIYDTKAQDLALQQGFILIAEDRNPHVYVNDADVRKAFAGQHVEISRSHAWLPFVSTTDIQSTVTAKVALMQNILSSHGEEIREPFHS